MKEETAKKLIGTWERLHAETSPSPRLLSLETDARRDLETLSVLSSRKEFWDCFVCLLGYADEKDDDPASVLDAITQEIDVEGVTDQMKGFLDYCQNISAVPRETMPTVVDTIVHLRGPGRPARDVFRFNMFETCLKLYPNPEDIDKFLACLLKQQTVKP